MSRRSWDRFGDYHAYLLLAPHVANAGWDNNAWIGDYKGVRMLFAERNGTCLAVACSSGWRRGSAGFVGTSDGWQDLSIHKTMTWNYRRAEHGNVALTGEVDLRVGDGLFLVALAFGGSAAEAGHRARASLLAGFPRVFDAYVHDWTEWHARHGASTDAVRISASVLRCHEEKRLPGAMIASLSIPWGDTKGDEDLGGYHLVWPRDLVEAAGGLIAVGAHADARRMLDYLRATQSADGSWPQNMWVSGEAYWNGVQLDETAFPILLVDLLQRHGGLTGAAANDYWPMIRHAAQFIVSNGPSSQQDRWEENAGLSPFTVAVEVAAVLIAADAADANGEADVAQYLRETADAWNEAVDECLYVQGSALASRAAVDGYYVRIAPPESADAASPAGGFVPIKNRPLACSRYAGGGDHQPRCAGAGPVRITVSRRPAHPRDGQRDRRDTQSRSATGPGVATLQRRWVRRACRWRSLRRRWRRTGLAPADWRARALRTRGRTA